MYEVYLARWYEDAEALEYQRLYLTRWAAKRAVRRAEKEGKDAFFLYRKPTPGALLRWAHEVRRSIPWWVWLLLL
jgi:hypothetical protein